MLSIEDCKALKPGDIIFWKQPTSENDPNGPEYNYRMMKVIKVNPKSFSYKYHFIFDYRKNGYHPEHLFSSSEEQLSFTSPHLKDCELFHI